MGHEFDKPYWDEHWQEGRSGSTAGHDVPANPHLVAEVGDLPPGTALEAGCGEGAEAIWLASAGWLVTGADIADAALARAAARAEAAGVGDRVSWVQADLGSWVPPHDFDLVTTHYAHPSMPQLEFYDRLSGWVAPGGSLLVVGHLHGGHDARHGHHADAHDDDPPPQASVTARSVTDRFDPATWEVVTATERTRLLDTPAGSTTLHDVVVRAVRRR